MNYKGKYLNQTKTFIEGDSIDFDFVVYDDYNTILSNTDLADFKFSCEITDQGQELTKEDANFDDGADIQISVTGKIVTVHVVENDTDDFEGSDFEIELLMTNIADSNKYTIYRSYLTFRDTITD